MSLRSIPLTLIAVLFYFFVVLASNWSELSPEDAKVCESATEINLAGCQKAAVAENLLRSKLFDLNMVSGAKWTFTWGDLILIVTLICLFAELMKATYTSTASLVDHGLSMLVFILAGIAFLLMPQAATSIFFLVLTALLIDVVAGFIIGIRVARRDIGLGGLEQ
jgi:hypothetical protein